MKQSVKSAFDTGRQAFSDGLKPLDNPFFADGKNVDLFNAWSDGWMFDDPISRGKFLPRNESYRTTRGLTATWERRDG
jgi:hypothetical protein